MSAILNCRINVSILLLAFLFVGSCNTNDAPAPDNGTPVVNTPDTTTAGHNPPVAITPTDSSNTFFVLKLSRQEYDYWNSHMIGDPEADEKIQAICKSEIYSVFKDDFDFIIFVMNNNILPKVSGMPLGIASGVKNDVQGIGLPIYDNTSSFGSAGKLQSISFLYTKQIDHGPILHEIVHRWANYVVPQKYEKHWDKVKGTLSNFFYNFADIELYLAGAIPASDMKDPESLAIYNDPRFNNGNKIPRIPDHTRSQKSFKALLAVVTPTDLTDAEMIAFNDRIANIVRLPAQGFTNLTFQNMYNKSRGFFSLSIGELNKSRK